MHLRILQVSQEPMVLNLSVLRNLTFAQNDVSNFRVKQVCKMLDMLTTPQLEGLELGHQGLSSSAKSLLVRMPKSLPQNSGRGIFIVHAMEKRPRRVCIG
eukprot:gnl/TRDRNA2_/TRDRNA2_165117_c1_seq3.p2 gnl/TRDRNA2_/TRDRNA2_165117_c1~~gnl/TRDRNA2_/TRDRNA2_165117_c1_seq3.p2  ORF type:complete len:100 (+),score=18.25 gnl/TRDRNA2_/TRDRNA2_165117_c1_seq3:226-525(+)